MIDLTPIRARFVCLSPHLDERERRLLAATEARLAGYGGIAAVARATGVAAIDSGAIVGFGVRKCHQSPATIKTSTTFAITARTNPVR